MAKVVKSAGLDDSAAEDRQARREERAEEAKLGFRERTRRIAERQAGLKRDGNGQLRDAASGQFVKDRAISNLDYAKAGLFGSGGPMGLMAKILAGMGIAILGAVTLFSDEFGESVKVAFGEFKNGEIWEGIKSLMAGMLKGIGEMLMKGVDWAGKAILGEDNYKSVKDFFGPDERSAEVKKVSGSNNLLAGTTAAELGGNQNKNINMVAPQPTAVITPSVKSSIETAAVVRQESAARLEAEKKYAASYNVVQQSQPMVPVVNNSPVNTTNIQQSVGSRMRFMDTMSTEDFTYSGSF